jgi:hypothetical protein
MKKVRQRGLSGFLTLFKINELAKNFKVVIYKAVELKKY